ncbi:hypothetical protein ACO2I3_15825 [Leptospira interrogans]
MQLGTLMERLASENDAATALEALGDIVLFAEVQAMGAQFDESPGEYVANAARRFAAQGGDEDWMGLMTAMERSQRPAHAALERMLRWSLKQDAAELAPAPASSCSCGGGTGGCHQGHN